MLLLSQLSLRLAVLRPPLPGPAPVGNVCGGSHGKKYQGPRSLNGRKQKLIADKPSIVDVLETWNV